MNTFFDCCVNFLLDKILPCFLITVVLPIIWRPVKRKLGNVKMPKIEVNGTHISVGAWRKSSKIRSLRKIKGMRSDSAIINHESNKANAFFMLFMTSILLYFFAFAFAAVLIHKIPDLPLIYMFLILLPTFVLEVFWLDKSSFVELLFKYRKKLKRLQS